MRSWSAAARRFSCARIPMHFMYSFMRRGRRRFGGPSQMDTRGQEAEEMVDTVDRERIAYVKHYFNADWPTRSLYHVMLNTAVGNEPVIRRSSTQCSQRSSWKHPKSHGLRTLRKPAARPSRKFIPRVLRRYGLSLSSCAPCDGTLRRRATIFRANVLPRA